MNEGPAVCDICGEQAEAREWLRCMLCGKRFHFASELALRNRDCGIVAPNPESENGC